MSIRFSRFLVAAVALVGTVGCCAPKSHERDLQALLNDFDQAEKDYEIQFGAVAETNGGSYCGFAFITDGPPYPTATFMPRFRAYIESHDGRPEAIDALNELLWITNRMRVGGQDADATWALEKIICEYANKPGVDELIDRLGGGAQQVPPERVLAFYDEVILTNPDSSIVAKATLAKGLDLAALHRRGRMVCSPKPRQVYGEELIRHVAQQYPRTAAGQMAAGYVYEMDHLQIGLPAPELVGTDVNGRRIRLADYRGKVVLIEFWGGYTSNTGKQIPHDPALVEHLRKLPFAIIGVSGHEDRARLRRVLARENVTWPNIDDGRNGGRVATAWNIWGWPTNFIIDQNGIIRYRQIMGCELEPTISNLLRSESLAKL